MAYGTVQADVIGTSVAGSNLGAGNASIMKNRLINSAMVINQRGTVNTPVTPADGDYTVDRWWSRLSASGKYSVQQTNTTAPTGFNNALLVTSLSSYSVSAGDYFTQSQQIEGFNTADLGWGTANAKTVTLSFQVYSSLTGTFGGSLANSAVSRSYPFSYTISNANTWTQISITIAGDTTGTWLTTNGIGMRVWFGLGVGSTYSGTAGSWASADYRSATGATSVVGTNGATFYITGVQLEVGSSATGFEYRQYGQELALCQRYYEIVGLGSVGSTLSTAFALVASTFKVTKRTSPTLTQLGSFTLTSPGNANYTASAISGSPTVSVNGISTTYVINSAPGTVYCVVYQTSTDQIAASSEL